MHAQHAVHQFYRRASRRLPFVRYVSLTGFVLTIVWLFVLHWGERSTFSRRIAACNWNTWEKWDQDAVPHHMVLVADPQLVDPHTYPGRPWPLNTLTEIYTDMYMARNFKLINSKLNPASVVFVGDLLDGGREWATNQAPPFVSGKEQENSWDNADYDAHSFIYGENGRWARWGPAQWDAEFERFGRIFLRPDQLHPDMARKPLDQHDANPDTGSQHRQVLTNLPGNHDVGFGAQVQLSVRERFESRFGKSNSVNVIGNHTFVFVDAPSYSAYDQYLQGGETTDEGREKTRPVWQPTYEFLENVGSLAENSVAKMLQSSSGDNTVSAAMQHRVVDMEDVVARASIDKPTKRALPGQAHLPVILLTHVPLFRAPETDCGPRRENGHSIAFSAGYQYQNVLTPTVTNNIMQKVSSAGEIRHVFSGDDHDYCEISHRFNLKNPHSAAGTSETTTMQTIKEITIKSFSWAMGVRLPGFLLVSLWNPVDHLGQPTGSHPSTIETHLCLLPDQLSIFIAYGKLLGFTLAVVLLRAVIVSIRFRPENEEDSDEDGSPTRSLLPQFRARVDDQTGYPPREGGFLNRKRDESSRSRNRTSSISTSSSTNANNTHLSVQRNFFTRTRSVSPAAGAPAMNDIPLGEVSVSLPIATGPAAFVDQAEDSPPYRWESPNESDEDLNIGDEAKDSQAKWKRRKRTPSRRLRFLAETSATLVVIAAPSVVFYGLLIATG